MNPTRLNREVKSGTTKFPPGRNTTSTSTGKIFWEFLFSENTPEKKSKPYRESNLTRSEITRPPSSFSPNCSTRSPKPSVQGNLDPNCRRNTRLHFRPVTPLFASRNHGSQSRFPKASRNVRLPIRRIIPTDFVNRFWVVKTPLCPERRFPLARARCIEV